MGITLYPFGWDFVLKSYIGVEKDFAVYSVLYMGQCSDAWMGDVLSLAL